MRKIDTHKAKEIVEGWTQAEVFDWFTEKGEHLRKDYLDYIIQEHCGNEYIMIHLNNFPEDDNGKDIYLLYNLSDEVERSVDALIDSFDKDDSWPQWFDTKKHRQAIESIKEHPHFSG